MTSSVCALALAVRLPAWMLAKHAGHADASYYYTLGRNLAAGRGFFIDYVWHFLGTRLPLTHYANDYWMPLPAVITAAPMYFLGSSMRVALLCHVLLSVTTAAGVSWLLLRSRVAAPTAFLAGAVTAIMPGLVCWSVQTDSATVATAAVFFSYACLVSSSGMRAALLAGLGLGIALVARPDACLAVPSLLWLAVRGNVGATPRMLASFALAASVPLLVVVGLNVIHGATPLPRSTPALFALNFEDVYKVAGPERSLFFDRSGWTLLQDLLSAVSTHLARFSRSTAHLGLPALMLVAMSARGQALSQAVLLHFGAVLAFYGVFAEVGLMGSFERSVAVVVPVLVLATVHAVASLAPVRVRVAWTTATAPAIVVGCMILSLSMLGAQRGLQVVARNNKVGEHASKVAEVIARDAARAIVMTRSPWELNAESGLKAVQAPLADVAQTLDVADYYGVTHVVVPSNHLRPALRTLVTRRQSRLLAEVDGHEVFALGRR